MARLKRGCVALAARKRKRIDDEHVCKTRKLEQEYKPQMQRLAERIPEPLRRLLEDESVLENLFITGRKEVKIGSTKFYKLNREILEENISILKEVWNEFVEITHSETYLEITFLAVSP